MMTKRIYYFIFPILILINSIFSVNQWSIIPVSITVLEWIVNFSIIGFCIHYYRYFFHPNNPKDYEIVKYYFIWMIFSTVRGMFVAENYWEWKQWAYGTTTLALPVLVYIFSNPFILKRTLEFWIKYGLVLFFCFIFWIVSADAFQFYLGPVLLLSCFIPILPRKWKLILSGLLILMIFADFGARSQVIKALMAIMMIFAFLISKNISLRILKIAHWCFYILPLVLLILGLTGIFNPFVDLSRNEGKYVENKVVNGQKVEDDLSADTRTFIYVEVISSAIKHNYVIWGRTAARGNDSELFGATNAEDLKTGKYERYCNEVCFPNVFTWLGLIGMILYCLIYLKSSYLAVYKSNNIYMKLVGVFIAFRFAYGWVEDFNRFDIMNISLWIMIAMGFSENYRSMNNSQFANSIFCIFNPKN